MKTSAGSATTSLEPRSHDEHEAPIGMPRERRVFAAGDTAFRRLAVCAALLAGALAVGLSGAGVVGAVVKPEEVGFSSERLGRIHETMQRWIERRQIAGAVTVVTRRGRIAHYETHGLMDVEARTPMRKDAIFRIASMSKPITGVAVMMLMEEGKLRLTDPVSRFIPEFKHTTVAVVKPGQVLAPRPAGQPAPGEFFPAPDYYTVPATREITVRDLLTHTSGLESGDFGLRVGEKFAPRDLTKTLADQMPKLATVPLDFQPGSQWSYSQLAGMDTLGFVVEVASGMKFDRFLQARLFGPLGMTDTGFTVADDKRSRVATVYNRTPHGIERGDTPPWLTTKTYFSGGGGLWSTADDYTRFAQMLANGGELDGVRILGSRTVAYMATNQLGTLYADSGPARQGLGFGLSMEVVLEPARAARQTSPGSFGWGGAFGTNFWVDPHEKLVGVLMVQTPDSGLRRDFETAVMQALVD